MFQFLKSAQPVLEDQQETGTYADALLLVPEVQLYQTNARERGHEAHARDYGHEREVARGSLGFA